MPLMEYVVALAKRNFLNVSMRIIMIADEYINNLYCISYEKYESSSNSIIAINCILTKFETKKYYY